MTDKEIIIATFFSTMALINTWLVYKDWQLIREIKRLKAELDAVTEMQLKRLEDAIKRSDV